MPLTARILIDYSMTSTQSLSLDVNIFYWVIIPIFLVMFMSGILRHFLTQALRSTPPTSLAATSHAQVLHHAQQLRHNGHLLLPSSFHSWVQHMLNSPLGISAEAAQLRKKDMEDEQEQSPTSLGMMDPTQMTAGLMQNFSAVVPNMLQMGWITYFFAGFVVVKLPFPLLDKFKVMLQRGIDVRTIDASYVSSLSWYLLNMFGLRSLYTLVLGSGAQTGDDEASLQQMAMPMGTMPMASGAMGGGVSYEAPYKNERDELEMKVHVYSVKDAELRLVDTWKKAQEQGSESSAVNLTRDVKFNGKIKSS